MRMRVSLLALLALAGCDAVFGVTWVPDAALGEDAPGDGIDGPDAATPLACSSLLAVEEEATYDDDIDGEPNGRDLCPFLGGPGSMTDADRDGIGDLCDPFPQVVGVRHCATTFLSSEYNASLWNAREDVSGWVPTTGSFMVPESAAQDASMVANAQWYPDTGNVSVDGWFRIVDSVQYDGELALYVSAQLMPGGSDLGCAIERVDDELRLVTIGAEAGNTRDLGPASASPIDVHVRATYQRGAAGAVTCEVLTEGATTWGGITNPVLDVSGALAFGRRSWASSLFALDITVH